MSENPWSNNQEVKNLIQEYKEGWFTIIELDDISQRMKWLSKNELINLKEYIEREIQEDAKSQLLELARDYINLSEPEYKFESLKHPNSTPFNKVRELFWLYFNWVNWIQNQAPENVKNIYENLNENQKTTLTIVLWENFIDKLSIPWFIQSKVETFIRSWESIMGEINGMVRWEWLSDENESINLSSSKAMILSIFKSEVWNSSNDSLLWWVKWYIDNFLDWEYKKLSDLHNLLNEIDISQENKNYILENPRILTSVLKNWEYSDENININLNNNILEVKWTLNISNLEWIKNEYIKELSLKNLDKWTEIQNNVNRIKNTFNSIANVAKRLWITPEKLDSLKENLFNIPVIWIFLKMIMWGSFFNNIKDALNWLSLSWDRKNSSEKLFNFLNTIEHEIKLNNGETISIERDRENPHNAELKSFFDKVSSMNNNEKYYKENDFWSIILEWKEIPNDWSEVKKSHLNIIKERVLAWLSEKNPTNWKISQNDFFSVLKEVDLSLPVIEEKQEEAVEPVVVEELTSIA